MTMTYKHSLLTTMLATAFSMTAFASETAPAHSYADDSVKGTGNISVTVDNIKSEDGYIMAALYNSKNTFLSDKIVRAQRVDIVAGRANFTYSGLPNGDYAISMYHDENGNTELDAGILGIPKEPYGFSNDAPVRFGPPKWDAAKFSINGSDAAQTITLK